MEILDESCDYNNFVTGATTYTTVIQLVLQTTNKRTQKQTNEHKKENKSSAMIIFRIQITAYIIN